MEQLAVNSRSQKFLNPNNTPAQANELLYQRQAQLERLTADRAALVMDFERRLAAAQGNAERASRFVTSGSEGQSFLYITIAALSCGMRRLRSKASPSRTMRNTRLVGGQGVRFRFNDTLDWNRMGRVMTMH